MSWKELPIDISRLHKDVFNNVQEDMTYLSGQAANLGYILSYVEAQANYDTQINYVLPTLQLLNGNIELLNTEITESVYYDNPLTITNRFTYEMYLRWRNILYDLYEIIVNGKGVWQQMTLTEEQDNPDAQIDGIDIYIRGDALAPEPI